MQRLLQECRFAHGNAQVFSEALAFASPEDLREKEIINASIYIFLTRCKPTVYHRNGTQSVLLPRN